MYILADRLMGMQTAWLGKVKAAENMLESMQASGK